MSLSKEISTQISIATEPLNVLRAAIDRADADWIGVQQNFQGAHDLVFRCRETKEVLSVPCPLTFTADAILDSIREKLSQHRAEFGNRKIHLRVSDLHRFRISLQKLEEDFNTLIGEKHVPD